MMCCSVIVLALVHILTSIGAVRSFKGRFTLELFMPVRFKSDGLIFELAELPGARQ